MSSLLVELHGLAPPHHRQVVQVRGVAPQPRQVLLDVGPAVVGLVHLLVLLVIFPPEEDVPQFGVLLFGVPLRAPGEDVDLGVEHGGPGAADLEVERRQEHLQQGQQHGAQEAHGHQPARVDRQGDDLQRFRVKCGRTFGSKAGKGWPLDLGRMSTNDAKTV